MAKINLLPWRAERRKLREREFYTMLGATAALAVLVLISAGYWMGLRIDNQEARNTYLEKQVTALDAQIKEIEGLDKVRTQLEQRKKIIEQLYADQSQTVHLFYEMAVTLPDALGLTTVKKTTEALKIEGVAQSMNTVSTYMKNIDKSGYLGQSDIDKIEDKGVNAKIPITFSLNVKLKKSEVEEKGTAKPGAKPGAPLSVKPMVTAAGAKV